MKAMYCGSFDPITKGHLDIIRRAAGNYDRLIVNVGLNRNKQTLFDADTRVRLIKEAVRGLPQCHKIDVIADPRMIVDIAMLYGVDVLIRGARQGTDDEMQERNLAEVNSCLAKIRGRKLVTEIIRQTDPFLCSVSSTMVKKLCEMKQFIAAERCVVPSVHQELLKKYLFDFWKAGLRNSTEYDWKKIVAAYSGRPYHNLSHLGYMFNMLQIYVDQTGLLNYDSAAAKELMLAICLHDYVYDVRRDDNETLSGDEAYKLCTYSAISAPKIKSLVTATAHDNDNLHDLQPLICDLDLSVLGTFNKKEWQRYTGGIRKEYGCYSDEEYIPARIRVLENFLHKERIFHTDFFFNMLEKQARSNLTAEVARLKQKL